MISYTWAEVKDKAEGFKEIIDGVVDLEITRCKMVDLEDDIVVDLDEISIGETRRLITDDNVKLFQRVVDKFEE